MSIWNLSSPMNSGFVHLLGSGREMYGTVIRHGKINKTVTVRVDYQYWNRMYARYFSRSANYLVHDEDNFTRTGDKIVIKTSPNLSKLKHYYVRNVVKQIPKGDVAETQETNPELNEEFRKIFQNFFLQEKQKGFMNKKKENEVKSTLKQKAMTIALSNLKKLQLEKEKQQNLASETEKVQEKKGKHDFLKSEIPFQNEISDGFMGVKLSKEIPEKKD
jgi:small subunit ribosomal protein S17